MSIFTIPSFGGGGGGGPGPPGPAGPVTHILRYTHGGGVPASGIQSLRLGVGVFSSENGDLITADFTIIGVSFATDALDAGHAFDVNVMTDPSGSGGTGPTAVATLPVPVSTQRVRDRTFSVGVAGLLDLGVEMIRTSGPATPSVFGEMTVLVEVTLP